jgi:DNA-binding NtrC family response regulator
MPDDAPQTILVVEDDPAVRRLIVRALSRNGFTVLGAGSATAGLAAFEAPFANIKLAIIDMVMPGMSGLDLAAELERRQPGIRILYISGHGDSIAMDSIARRRPEFVLLKPFVPGTIVTRVQQLLQQV